MNKLRKPQSGAHDTHVTKHVIGMEQHRDHRRIVYKKG